MTLLDRMAKWLDAGRMERRWLKLFPSDDPRDGPPYCIEYSTADKGPEIVFGKSRDECMDKIERETS